MNARWAPGILLASIGLALAGCDSGQSRTFHGQINMSDYGLRQPVVLVESGNNLGYVARVSATGSFSIAVPSGQSYRLTLADRTTAGPLALVSRILWSAKGQSFAWARIGNGSTINFGLIRPLGATVSGPSPSSPGLSAGNNQGQNSNSQGENDDSQCDENDDAQGDEQGPAGSGATCQPQMLPPSNPPLCMPGSIGSSKGDRDEDGEQDDHDYGDDDRDGNGGPAAQCGDGGVMMGGGDDDNQGNDNAQGNENEDDDDGANGKRCVKHVPMCPPAPAPGGGTPPPGSPDLGTPPPPPPPPGSPDLGTPAPIT
jgi:hypothetical protein